MKLHEDLWKTMYNQEFDNEKYFYHYTSVNKAIKILYGDCLKFSKLNRLNDTLESKPKISNKSFNDSKIFTNAFNYFREIANNDLQLLCFSKDSGKKDLNSIDLTTELTDYSGRGFALPRMWAQYADNNNGVCLIFDKEEIKKIISCSIGPMLVMDDSVKYVNEFANIDINYNEIGNLLDLNERIGNEGNKFVFFLNFVKNNIDFIKYNYFTKLDDWEREQEYRFLALGNEEYFIKNISEALAGIVVGEKIDGADQSMILSMSKFNCQVMKINFSFQGCKLERIYE